MLRIMDPSAFDRTSVDWTPGLAARRDKLSKVEAGYAWVSDEQILAET